MKKLKLHELGRDSVETYKNKAKRPLRLVLDNVRSALNVGSAFRTADCFALEGIDLCGITAKPPHKEIRKSAIGATESVDWLGHENTIDCVKQLLAQGYAVYCVEQTEESLSLKEWIVKDPLNTKIALVFGNEVEGVDQEVIDLCKKSLEIPQYGTKHSFNISVSIGVVLWQYEINFQ